MSNANKKIDIVAVAKKKRHIQLLEKLKVGKKLTKAEIKELEEFEKSSNKNNSLPFWVVGKQVDVAAFFDVNVRQIQRWKSEPAKADGSTMPVREDGKYDIQAIVRWRQLIDSPNSNKSFEDLEEEKLTVEISYRKEKLKLEQMKVAEIEGTLIPVDQVHKEQIRKVKVVQQALIGLPVRIAAQLVGRSQRQIEAIMLDKIEEIINAFSRGQTVKEKKQKKK